MDHRIATAKAFHTQEELLRYFDYNPETGKVYWKVSKGNIKAGTEVKTPHNTGYISVQVDGISYLLHRVIWCMIYGEFPSVLIDHENLNRKDNRLKNLRLATGANNCQNAGLRKDNTSGVKGVSWHKRIGKWQARVQLNGARSIKYFENLNEAESYVTSLRKELHKEFTNHGVKYDY
jgi:hypothetical protein